MLRAKFVRGFCFCFLTILAVDDTILVARRRAITIGLRFIGLALNVGRLALRACGLTVVVVRLARTFTVFLAGLPTEDFFFAFTRDVVRLVLAFVRDVLFLDVDFLPLVFRPPPERPLLDLLLERPLLLDLDPPRDLPRELERPLLLERPRERPRERPPRLAIIFYAPLKLSKLKLRLVLYPRT